MNPLLERVVQNLKGFFGAATLRDLGADRLLRFVLLGDIVALDEDAGRSAIARHDRLVDEIEIALDEDPIRTVLQIDGRAAPDMGLARSINRIEQPDEALLDHFGERFRDCPSDDIAGGDQRPVGFVHHGEAMLGSAQHRNESGRLLEHELQALALGLELPLDPHLVGDFDDDGHDAGWVCRLRPGAGNSRD